MKIKKIVCLVMSALLISCCIPFVNVSASTGWTLSQMKASFPHGKYWNHLAKSGHSYHSQYGWIHYGDACGDIMWSVTDYPCYAHNAIAPVGQYDCNTYYNQATQCAGFARLMADLAFDGATNVPSWSQVTNKSTAISVVKPGDVIHYKGGGADATYGHWAFVIGVNGSNVILGECGVSNNCNISWGRSFNLNNATSLTLYRAPEVWTGNVNSYYLDVNGYLNGESSDSINGFGTVDIYINGALVADDVSDFYVAYDAGTSYEIKDIKTFGCNEYKGESSYSGILNAGVNINLNFETAHNYNTTVIPATCTDNEKHVKTCSGCNISITEDAGLNPVWSDWTTEKPGVELSRIESKTQFRYWETETKLTTESNLEGWTYVGQSWSDGKKSSVAYVDTWPVGFDKNNALYAQYNNSAPVALTTATKRSEVGETTTQGYIYWHWCSSYYNGSSPINRYINDVYTDWDAQTSRPYNVFHAFYSNEYKNITAGAGAVDFYNADACLQTYWWQPAIAVKSTAVTTYELLNEFTRDKGWSEWSDIAFSIADDTKFESRTVYRYIISGVPATGHTWGMGVITKPATDTENGTKIYTCKDCGTTKEESYNKSDYVIGDVNADGKIDAADALLVLKYAARIDISKETFMESAALTNSDAKIDAADALNILKYAARIIDVFPVEK